MEHFTCLEVLLDSLRELQMILVATKLGVVESVGHFLPFLEHMKHDTFIIVLLESAMNVEELAPLLIFLDCFRYYSVSSSDASNFSRDSSRLSCRIKFLT